VKGEEENQCLSRYFSNCVRKAYGVVVLGSEWINCTWEKKNVKGMKVGDFPETNLLVRSSGGIDRYTQLTYCVSNFFFLEKRGEKKRLFSPPAIRGSWLPAGPADSRSLPSGEPLLPHCGHETRGRTASPTLVQAPMMHHSSQLIARRIRLEQGQPGCRL